MNIKINAITTKKFTEWLRKQNWTDLWSDYCGQGCENREIYVGMPVKSGNNCIEGETSLWMCEGD